MAEVAMSSYAHIYNLKPYILSEVKLTIDMLTVHGQQH